MDSNDWAALGAVVAGVAALAALYFSWRSAKASQRSARAAEEQTEIQRQLRKDAAQPYVWADIRMDDATGHLLNVMVGNSGPTVAEKVRVKFDPPLPTKDDQQGIVKTATAILADGIESLAPGHVLQWNLGTAHSLLKDDKVLKVYRITVSAQGPFGTLPALTYIVDMSNWLRTLVRPSGSLFMLTKAVKELPQQIASFRTD